MKKKTITKGIIMKAWGETLDTKPYVVVGNTTHLERIINWLEFNDYNITVNSINNIKKYIEVRKQLMEQMNVLAQQDIKNTFRNEE